MSTIVLVTTTLDDRFAADSLVAAAVTDRLAACAQVSGPVSSTYRWEGRLETTQEWLVQFKTAADRADALTARVLERHPYDVPEVVVMPTSGGSADYDAWVVAETRP